MERKKDRQKERKKERKKECTQMKVILEKT